MATTWTTKDPSEVKEYSVDWTGKFTYDYITTSTWAITAGSGLTIDSNRYTDNKTFVKLSSGTNAVTYTLTNTIVTSKGYTHKQAFSLPVATAS